MADQAETDELTRLREEVHYWRTIAAVHARNAASELTRDLDARTRARLLRMNFSAERRLMEWSGNLTDALAGKYHDDCGICAEQVKREAPVIPDVDMGDCHAECCGATQADITAGRMSVPLAELVLDDELDPAARAAIEADPHVSIYRSSGLYTPERIVQIAAETSQVLAGHIAAKRKAS